MPMTIVKCISGWKLSPCLCNSSLVKVCASKLIPCKESESVNSLVISFHSFCHFFLFSLTTFHVQVSFPFFLKTNDIVTMDDNPRPPLPPSQASHQSQPRLDPVALLSKLFIV